jgi:hypothetical protein
MPPMGVAWLLLLPNTGIIWWLGFVGGMGVAEMRTMIIMVVCLGFDLAKERF